MRIECPWSLPAATFEDPPQPVGVGPTIGIVSQDGDRLGLRHAKPEFGRPGELLLLKDPPALDLGRRPEMAQDGDAGRVEGDAIDADRDDARFDLAPHIRPAAGDGLAPSEYACRGTGAVRGVEPAELSLARTLDKCVIPLYELALLTNRRSQAWIRPEP